MFQGFQLLVFGSVIDWMGKTHPVKSGSGKARSARSPCSGWLVDFALNRWKVGSENMRKEDPIWISKRHPGDLETSPICQPKLCAFSAGRGVAIGLLFKFIKLGNHLPSGPFPSLGPISSTTTEEWRQRSAAVLG